MEPSHLDLHCLQMCVRIYLMSEITRLYPKCKLSTTGDWDCVAAVERLPALHYSVDFIFLSFGIMGFIVEL